MNMKIRVLTGLLALFSCCAMAERCDDGWEIVFSDPGVGDWHDHWFVEGLKAIVEYDEGSLIMWARSSRYQNFRVFQKQD